MKANELRIGNFVNVQHGSLTKRMMIKQIIALDLENIEQGRVFPYIYAEIPLTEEWLLKFGFDAEKCGLDIFWRNDEIEIIQSENHSEFILSVSCGEYAIGDYFKYVHQLQNLYFALTNVELTIKQ